MRIAVAVGFVGRTMIRAGILILLFVAYQLWGTGMQTARAQDQLESTFREQQAELGQGDATPQTTSDTTGSAGATSTTAPAVTAPADLTTPEKGEPVGFISIPDIGSEFFIVQGVELRWLEEGPGHFPNTPLPGQPGNAALAGHRTTYKAPFNRIDELQPGALIFVETLQGTFTYEVMAQPAAEGETPIAHYIVGPQGVEILDDKGDNRLTLMACHPKYSAAQRIVVEAKLVSNPAVATPVPDDGAPIELAGEDLVGGDEAARIPALLLSLLAISIWFLAWFVGHRWAKWRWPAYLVAFPCFTVTLFFAFDSINRSLPGAY